MFWSIKALQVHAYRIQILKFKSIPEKIMRFLTNSRNIVEAHLQGDVTLAYPLASQFLEYLI